MKTRSIRAPARHHVEAFPRLDLREARAQVMTRIAGLLWRNQRGDVVGQASATIQDRVMTVTASFIGPPGQPPRVVQTDFHLRVVGHGGNPTDCLAKCDECGKDTRIFVFRHVAGTPSKSLDLASGDNRGLPPRPST